MLANYHTHTWRCNHAEPDERAYIEAAIAAGIRILGFADHTPCPFPDGHTSYFRMSLAQSGDYFATIRRLRDEYAGQIEIYAGVEAEYYPDLFPALVDHLRQQGCEYMLLGQHFLLNEEDGIYNGRPTTDEKRLIQYVDQVIEGLSTGRFTYLAHPDLLLLEGNEPAYRLHMRRLCRAARKMDIPLELNLLGLREGRHYPRRAFWELAAAEGNRVVLGVDAHQPEALCRPDIEATARRFLADLGLTPEDAVPLIPIRS
ncbi:MAG: PHP domain-containing protein [Ruminococcaceae bacterium]|jgi:histidinol-phosphatase (PHP family)|nr:PHP domain-containing protein [Oscillospiraceae bacterium]